MFRNIIIVVCICFTFVLITYLNTNFSFVINGIKANWITWFIEWVLLDYILASREVNGNGGSGADTDVYIEAFLNREKQDFEPLFNILNSLLRNYIENYHVYLFFVHGLMLACLLFFIHEFFDYKNQIIAILLTFSIYIQMYNLLRQWLAVSIGLVSLVLWKKNRRIMALIFCVASVFIHKSMIVYVGVLLLCLLVDYFSIQINYIALLFASGLINFFFIISKDYFVAFVSHTGYRAYVTNEMLSTISWIGYIPTIIFLILCLCFGRELEEINAKNRYILLFGFANLSLMYVNTGLGMWRLTQILFPIRMYLVYQLILVIKKGKRIGFQPCLLRTITGTFALATIVRYILSGIKYMEF